MAATSFASGDGEPGAAQGVVGFVDTAAGKSAVTTGTDDVEIGTTKLLRLGEKGDEGIIA